MKTTCGIWDCICGCYWCCCYCWFIYPCNVCTYNTSSSCTSIYVWKSYNSSPPYQCACWCCTLIVISSCGDLFLSHFIYFSYYFLFFFCDELVSFYGLEGTCFITTSRIITPYGFAPPIVNFWGWTFSLDFLLYFDHSPMLDLFFFFFHGPWGYHRNSFRII